MVAYLKEVAAFYADPANLNTPFEKEFGRLLSLGKTQDVSVSQLVRDAGFEVFLKGRGSHPYYVLITGILPQFHVDIRILFKTDVVQRNSCKCGVSHSHAWASFGHFSDCTFENFLLRSGCRSL